MTPRSEKPVSDKTPNLQRIDANTLLRLRQWCERQPSPEEQVALARAGDKDEARNLLERFCAHLEARKAAPDAVTDYMAKALRAVLDGQEPKKALGLVTAGRPPDAIFLRKQLAARVFLLMRAGHTKEVAAEWVADEFVDQIKCWKEIDRRMERGEAFEDACSAALVDIGLPLHRLIPRADVDVWRKLAVTKDKALRCYEDFRQEIIEFLA